MKTMDGRVGEDGRSTKVVERLMEDSWRARTRRWGRREVIVEAAAGAVFLCCSVPLAVGALAAHGVDVPLAALLVAMYAIVSRLIRFPIGAGFVVPSYLVLIPMLVLLPAGLVPLLAAAGLVAGTLVQALKGRVEAERVVLSVPDAWHSLGPAAVLLLAGTVHGVAEQTLLCLAAFVAASVVDLLSATVREAAILGLATRVQLRVIAQVWLIDACITPIGLIVAISAREYPATIALLLPLLGLLLLISNERNARIEQAKVRLEMLARERGRLQAAVGRLGEAFAAKLDLDALAATVLRGSVEALDADGGRLVLDGPHACIEIDEGDTVRAAEALAEAAADTRADGRSAQLERDGLWALALPFCFSTDGGEVIGSLAVCRQDRQFRADEEQVALGLIDGARRAAADIIASELVRQLAFTDALTGLGNRRRLTEDVAGRIARATDEMPLVLIMYDLDGFKHYNDTFGHLAGDALLERLAGKLTAAVGSSGDAYRLGGDEFCALLQCPPEDLQRVIGSASGALQESGENFTIGASYGAVLIGREASSLDHALQLADERMYQRKRSRRAVAGDHTRDVLMSILSVREPSLEDHSSAVAELCLAVGRRLGMNPEELDELARGAEFHDVGKVGIPDEILAKPSKLTEVEWEFMRQHTILGERILNAAPPLRPVATIVRSTHERWDGRGYPDGLCEAQIPLAARIIAACDSYDAMTTDRCYRTGMSREQAITELGRCRGTQFDPQVIDVLLDVLAGQPSPESEAREAAAERLDSDRRTADEIATRLLEVMSKWPAPGCESAPTAPERYRSAHRNSELHQVLPGAEYWCAPPSV